MSLIEKKHFSVRRITLTAILAALASVLMFLNTPVPFMPSFIKLDISEFPALMASFSIGPVYGVIVCLIKNLINLPFTITGGVGELSNFLLGCALVVPSGILYRVLGKKQRGVILGCLCGAVTMALASFPINYFITYPAYSKLLPVDAIIGMYQAIFGGVNGLAACLLIFNVPFTFLKGLLASLLTIFLHRRVSKFLKE